jgi:hypothetical protein
LLAARQQRLDSGSKSVWTLPHTPCRAGESLFTADAASCESWLPASPSVRWLRRVHPPAGGGAGHLSGRVPAGIAGALLAIPVIAVVNSAVRGLIATEEAEAENARTAAWPNEPEQYLG